jgi:hypothetical protein
MEERRDRIVYKQYVGYGKVEEVDPKKRGVDGARKSIKKYIPLEVLEDIAWM